MMVPPGLHIRKEVVEGIGPWVWVASDRWGWEQPREEFPALRDLILSKVRGRGRIVQAGGCCGMYPRLWAEYFDTVYTFEPDALNFYCLSANCGSDKIIKLQAALSDTTGTVSIEHTAPGNVGMHRIGKPPGHVPAIRLDNLILHDIDAIQLDCEGHEGKIIEGALQTIHRCMPLIAIEAPSKELTARLEDLGYSEAGRCGANPDVVFVHSDIA